MLSRQRSVCRAPSSATSRTTGTPPERRAHATGTVLPSCTGGRFSGRNTSLVCSSVTTGRRSEHGALGCGYAVRPVPLVMANCHDKSHLSWQLATTSRNWDVGPPRSRPPRSPAPPGPPHSRPPRPPARPLRPLARPSGGGNDVSRGGGGRSRRCPRPTPWRSGRGPGLPWRRTGSC